VDGKRISLQAPVNSGSFYFDYKQQFSLVLMAMVDANYKFTYIDVGANGRQSDAGVYGNCSLSEALEKNSLNLPAPSYLTNSKIVAPYVVVADDAFALKTYMIKPFPERLTDDLPSQIFNYRLSRARRIVENAFGMLANRWRLLRDRIALKPETATKVVLACCALQNFLISHTTYSRHVYMPSGLVDTENINNELIVNGKWREEAMPTSSWMNVGRQLGNNNPLYCAKAVRISFRDYFNGPGAVPWQEKMRSKPA